MKTNILKLSVFAIIIVTLFGCHDDKNCEKENENLKAQLELNNKKLEALDDIIYTYNESNYLNSLYSNIPEDGHINQKDRAITELSHSLVDVGRYDVFGDFSIADDRLTVFIPVTKNNLTITDYQDISTPNINALLIKIEDGTGQATPLKPIVKVIEKTFSLKSLGLDETELAKDKKIKVIILNDDTTDITSHRKFYQECIKVEDNYDKNSCMMPKNKSIRPNEDGGDIIVGG